MTLPTRDNTSNPRQWGYDVRLGEIYLRLAVRPSLSELVVESAPLQADRVDTRSSAEEMTNEFGSFFARSDFSGGEGLARAHQRDSRPGDVARYFDSKNIDVDDEGRATLLTTSENLDTSTAATVYGVYADGNVWFTDGQTLSKTSNPTAATPSFSADDPHAAEGAQDVTGLVAIGTTVYAACTVNGIHRLQSGGAWAHWSDVLADRVWATKGRVLAVEGNELYEARSAATSVLLLTLGDGHTINDVVDAGPFILAAASDGLIYAFTFDGTDVAFIGQSTPISEGEVPTALASSLGRVYLSTAEDLGSGTSIGRLYVGQVADDGVLVELSVIKQWDDGGATDQTPAGLHTPRRASVFMGNAQGTETHLWRYDAASDGMHRSHVAADVGAVRSIFRVEDRLWWTIDGEGIYRNTETLATTGYLISPSANFFTEDEKSWAGLRAVFDEMPDGTQARIAYTTEQEALEDATSSSWTPFATFNTANSQSELTFPSISSRIMALRITFTASGGNSPLLRSFTIRAYPGQGDTLLSLPVNISDRIERGGRSIEVRGRGDELFEHLLGLAGPGVELELLREGKRFSGTVQQVSQPSQFTPSRGSRWMVSTVVFRGRELAEGSVSDNSFGVGLFGEGMFGQREGVAA